MKTFEEAYACVLSHAPKLSSKKVPLIKARSLLLKEDIKATRPIPPFHRVAMDGIAVNSLQEKTFTVIGTQYAGEKRKKLTTKPCCLEVMTGAILPSGAKAIIRYEDLEKKTDVFTLKPGISVTNGQNIHFKGIDAKKNSLVLLKNCILTPPRIALLASLGKKTVLVQKELKISILATGSEIVLQPKAHQIYSSNAEAIFTATGAKANIFYAKDTLPSIQKGIKKGLATSDILLISGGCSLGKKDLVPHILETFNIKKLIHGVFQKPGKPFLFGKASSGGLVFGLPGNPVAMLISLYLYVLPLLGRTQKTMAILGETIPTLSPSYAHFILVNLINGYAIPVQSHGSGDLVTLAETDGFILPKTGKKGELVQLWLWE